MRAAACSRCRYGFRGRELLTPSSTVAPELRDKRQNERENLQTSCQHEEGMNPDDGVGQDIPRAHSPYMVAYGRTDVGKRGDGQPHGIEQGQA